jgi:hypothetical protein
MESESEQSDQASDQSESESGSNLSGSLSESGDERKAMSTRRWNQEQTKRPRFPKKKGSKQRILPRPTTSGQRSSKSPDPAGSNNGKKDSKVVKPAKPHTTFQETMKNLEKKYSKVELAKIAGIFSALDLGEEVSDSVVDDQSTSPGSGSQ